MRLVRKLIQLKNQTTMFVPCSKTSNWLSKVKGIEHPKYYRLLLHADNPRKRVWLKPGELSNS